MNNKSKALQIVQNNEQRRGLLARMLKNNHNMGDIEHLQDEHSLARLEIELETDLKRHRRKAHHYLEVTAMEDKANTEITKHMKYEEICEQIDELYKHDLIISMQLKARVKRIFKQNT
jgi:hypothetical protein